MRTKRAQMQKIMQKANRLKNCKTFGRSEKSQKFADYIELTFKV